MILFLPFFVLLHSKKNTDIIHSSSSKSPIESASYIVPYPTLEQIFSISIDGENIKNVYCVNIKLDNEDFTSEIILTFEIDFNIYSTVNMYNCNIYDSILSTLLNYNDFDIKDYGYTEKDKHCFKISLYNKCLIKQIKQLIYSLQKLPSTADL